MSSPTAGPHVVHFSDVKETVEVESGRFEFFKQILTIGLGGIAGLAAILTDPDKIPDEFWRIGMLSLFAIFAIVVVICSADGISTYANYLREVRRLSRDPENAKLKQSRDEYEESILNHANVALVGSWIGAASLIAFSGLMLFGAHAVGAEAAMRAARKIVSEQPGNPAPQTLDHFQTIGSDYLVTYVTGPGQVKYSVKVDRNTNSILEITKP
jgi:hypothetical protein